MWGKGSAEVHDVEHEAAISYYFRSSSPYRFDTVSPQTLASCDLRVVRSMCFRLDSMYTGFRFRVSDCAGREMFELGILPSDRLQAVLLVLSPSLRPALTNGDPMLA